MSAEDILPPPLPRIPPPRDLAGRTWEGILGLEDENEQFKLFIKRHISRVPTLSNYYGSLLALARERGLGEHVSALQVDRADDNDPVLKIMVKYILRPHVDEELSIADLRAHFSDEKARRTLQPSSSLPRFFADPNDSKDPGGDQNSSGGPSGPMPA